MKGEKRVGGGRFLILKVYLRHRLIRKMMSEHHKDIVIMKDDVINSFYIGCIRERC